MTDQSASRTQAYDEGLQIRREVLGDDYVNEAVASGNGFKRPLQEYITEVCWARVWGRDGLDRRTRSFINLAMLTALGKPKELRLHVQGALNNGCTPDEISEVLLQAAVYCGAPAALEAYGVAEGVVASHLEAQEAAPGDDVK